MPYRKPSDQERRAERDRARAKLETLARTGDPRLDAIANREARSRSDAQEQQSRMLDQVERKRRAQRVRDSVVGNVLVARIQALVGVVIVVTVLGGFMLRSPIGWASVAVLAVVVAAAAAFLPAILLARE